MRVQCAICNRTYGAEPTRCICGSVNFKNEVKPKELKTDWNLLYEFEPAIERIAALMTAADADGKHPKNSFLKESADHQWECFQRHIYAYRHGDIWNTEDFGGKFTHLECALTRLHMYYRLKARDAKALQEQRSD